MSDSYQAIHNAVSSAFGIADHAVRCVAEEFSISAAAMKRPSVLYRPVLTIDGNQWCAMYGDDLQNGVAGFGDSPEAAMADFDKSWSTALQCKAA